MLAYKVGTSFSDNYMLCRTMGEVGRVLEQETCHNLIDLKTMAEEGEYYKVVPIDITPAEFERVYNQEFPGW